MKTKLIVKKILIIAIIIVSIAASQAVSAMVNTAKTSALALYKASLNVPKGTWYEILGVSKNATQAEIKAAYHTLALKHHPDKFTNPIDKAKAQETFQKISEANNLATEKISSTKLSKAQEEAVAKAEETMKNMHDFKHGTWWEKFKAAQKLKNDEYAHKTFWEEYAKNEKAKGFSAETIAQDKVNLIRQWENTKGVGHAAYTIPGLIYGANRVDKLEFQDDLYNSHMETISSDEEDEFKQFMNDQLTLEAQSSPEQLDQENPITEQSISQVNQQAPSMWATITENSAGLATDAVALMNDNPIATAAVAAALVGTAGYYTYKYVTTPTAQKENEQTDKEATTAEQDANFAGLQEELKDAKKASSWSSRWKW